MATTKKERAEQANRFLEAIAGCGRKFFAHNGRVSRFEVDERGAIWFVDAHREAKIYTACKWSRWRGFSEGGTLRPYRREVQLIPSDEKRRVAMWWHVAR